MCQLFTVFHKLIIVTSEVISIFWISVKSLYSTYLGIYVYSIIVKMVLVYKPDSY